jgi:hypothetical protein
VQTRLISHFNLLIEVLYMPIYDICIHDMIQFQIFKFKNLRREVGDVKSETYTGRLRESTMLIPVIWWLIVH